MKTGSTLAFGVSTFGKTLLWTTFDVYGLYSLTALLELKPATASGVFLLLLVWSALADMGVGWLADRRLSARSANRLMRVGSPLAGCFFVLGFAPFTEGWGVGVALTAALLFRLCFSSFDVPHNSLLRTLGTSQDSRRRLSAVRLFSTIAASYCVGGLALVFLSAGEGDSVEAYRGFAVVVAALGTAMFLVTPGFAATSSTVAAPPNSSQGAKPGGRRPIEILGAMTIGVVGVSLFMKSLPFAADSDFSDPRWAGQALIALTTGRLLGLGAWQIVGGSLSALSAGVAAYGASTLAAAFMGICLALGWALPLAFVLLGVAMAGVSLSSWVIAADLADAQGSVGEVRSRVFGLFTGLSKVALGIGGSLLGLWLATPYAQAFGVLDAACFALAVSAAAAALLLGRRRITHS